MTHPYNSTSPHRQIQFAMTDRFGVMSADYCDCIGRDPIGLEIMAEEREAVFTIWCAARDLAYNNW